jgi:hypothetical protein
MNKSLENMHRKIDEAKTRRKVIVDELIEKGFRMEEIEDFNLDINDYGAVVATRKLSVSLSWLFEVEKPDQIQVILKGIDDDMTRKTPNLCISYK